MKPVEPTEFFVVLEPLTGPRDLGFRSIFGPKQSRIVLCGKTLEDVAFEWVVSWHWRPGDYKTRMRGWKTLAGAQGAARKLATQVGALNRGGVALYQLMEDTDGEWYLRPVECGAADTADREPQATDRGPSDEDPRG